MSSVIRREDGSLRKENPDVTANLETTLLNFKTALSRAEIMSSLTAHPGWQAIQEVLQEKLKGIEYQIDNFHTLDHRQNDLLLQERRNYKFFIGIVDDFVHSMAGFESKIAQYEKQLDARKSATAPV